MLTIDLVMPFKSKRGPSTPRPGVPLFHNKRAHAIPLLRSGQGEKPDRSGRDDSNCGVARGRALSSAFLEADGLTDLGRGLVRWVLLVGWLLCAPLSMFAQEGSPFAPVQKLMEQGKFAEAVAALEELG